LTRKFPEFQDIHPASAGLCSDCRGICQSRLVL